jgi:predicted HicB family RNase H-like nuclease
MKETQSKMGRPTLPKKEKRAKFITTRLSPPEHAEIEQAANEAGEAKTTWARKKLLAAARRS